jgi:hypothetical protein
MLPPVDGCCTIGYVGGKLSEESFPPNPLSKTFIYYYNTFYIIKQYINCELKN